VGLPNKADTSRSLLIASCPCVLAAAFVAAGGLRLLPGGVTLHPRGALNSLVLYWLAIVGLILLWRGLRYQRSKTILLVFSAAFAFGLAEAVLRATYPPSWRPTLMLPSAEYHHVNLPDRTMYWGTVDGEHVTVSTNADGLRSHYTREEFLDYRHRVVAMGDSYTFGFAVCQDKAYPQVMEGMLREQTSCDDIAVLNAGCTSWSPFVNARFYEGVVRHYSPTVVVYALDATDIGDDYRYAEELAEAGGRFFALDDGENWPSPRMGLRPSRRYWGAVGEVLNFDWVAEKVLAPVEWFDVHVLGNPPAKPYDWGRFMVTIGDDVVRDRYFIFRYPLEQTAPFFEQTFENIKTLAAEVKRDGGEFVLAVLPRYHHWNPQECPEDRTRYECGETIQYDWFRFFEEKQPEVEFEIVSLLPEFRQTEIRPLVFEWDPHFNAEGHAVAAEAIAQHLIEKRRFQ